MSDNSNISNKFSNKVWLIFPLYSNAYSADYFSKFIATDNDNRHHININNLFR